MNIGDNKDYLDLKQREKMIQELKNLLETETKHGNYQTLPPALLNLDSSLDKYSPKIEKLDIQRYKWITSKIDFKEKKVLDIGGNIGYFSLRLATEKDARVTIYEPFEKHSRLIDIGKKLLNLSDQKLINIKKGIGLEDIKKLDRQDIVLLLNVVQHAGEDFDKLLVKEISEWKEYAVKYLLEIRNISNYLVFQNGYTWLGDNGELCQESEILDFTIQLLKESGWEIKYCGIIKNINKPCYSDYQFNLTDRNRHPLINNWNRIVFNALNKIKNYPYTYRFMQRPLFVCKNMASKE